MESSNRTIVIIYSLFIITVLLGAVILRYVTLHKNSSVKDNLSTGYGYSEQENINAIDEKIITALASEIKGVLISSKLKNTYEGIIVELEYEEGFKIRIKGQSGNTNGYAFIGYPDNMTEVVKRNDQGIETVADINDLNLGDRVILEIKADLLDDLTNYFTEVKITVIDP